MRVCGPISASLFHPTRSQGTVQTNLNVPPKTFIVTYNTANLFGPIGNNRFVPLILRRLCQHKRQGLRLLLFNGRRGDMSCPFPDADTKFVASVGGLTKLCDTTSVFLGPALRSILSGMTLRSVTYGAPSIAFQAKKIPGTILSKEAKLITPRKSLGRVTTRYRQLVRSKGLLRALTRRNHQRTRRAFSCPIVTTQRTTLCRRALQRCHCRR